jgi:Mor family transcriptional regulator
MKTKQIANFENYEISDTGIVISNKQSKPKILKPREVSQSKKKYLQVSLYNEFCKIGKHGWKLPKQLYVHRLVWETFVGEIPEGYEIDHIDNNPHNNNLSNLQLLSRTENVNKHYTRADVRYLREHRDEIIKDYIELQSYSKLAEKWECTAASIWRIVNNVIHRYSKSKKQYINYSFNEEDNDLFATTDLRNKTKEQLIELWEKNYGVKYNLELG